jgi:hypothetical protein
VINGRVLMKDRRLMHMDLEKIMADAWQIAETIRGH